MHTKEAGFKRAETIIIGAGPAGLSAAYELKRHGLDSVVLEQRAKAGGLSRTETYRGYLFDIGGHRFFTKVAVVKRMWREILGDEMLVRPRLSRIYYGGVFYSYPLEPLETVWKLGVFESALSLLSYLKARVMRGDAGVSGEVPAGTFSARTIRADMGARTLTRVL